MLRKRKSCQDVMQDFIEIVVTEMESQQLSMSELARRAEVARPYLHRVLSREQMPSMEWVQKVLAALHLRVTFEKF
jgi:DNA-binding phage protein